MTTAVTTTAMQPTQVNALTIIERMSSDPACDPAKLREVLAVRREWDADEARKAFSFAISRFQRECPVVPRLDVNDGKKYARMDRIWCHIRPLLSACGLSVTWERTTIADDICHLHGHLRHESGHAEPIEYMLPIPDAIKRSDGKPIQNKAQVMGSATTYAKRYATCSVLGVQTGEDNDASLPSRPAEPLATMAQRKEIAALAKTLGVPDERAREIMETVAGVNRSAELPAGKVQAVLDALNGKYKDGLFDE